MNSAAAKSLQCPTLCDPIDGSPPGSSVPGIFQARVLEWGAIAFSEKQAEVLLNHILTNSHLEQDLQDLLEQTSKKESYSHQYSMVVTQRQKYRSMEQNRKPRDKSMHLWTPYL